MPAPGAVGAARVLAALLAAALCGHLQLGVSATLNSVLVNSNAIKNLPPALGGAAGHPGSAVSAAPGILYEGGNKYQTIDNYQVSRVSGNPGCGDPEARGGCSDGEEHGECVECVQCGAQSGSLRLGALGTPASERCAQRAGDERRGPGAWGPGGAGASRPCLAPPRSRTRAPRTRSAARRSTAPAPRAREARARKSASPAGSAENAACVTLCAAPGITAKMVSPVAPFRTQSVPHLASYGWEENAPGFGNPVAPPANGCSACRVPQKSLECLIWEVVERLLFLRAPGLLNRTACHRVNPSLNMSPESTLTSIEKDGEEGETKYTESPRKPALALAALFLLVSPRALPRWPPSPGPC